MMVWKENGKYGVSTGRTVRSSFAHGSYRTSKSDPELFLKFTRGTEKLSDKEMVAFWLENDINDGLGALQEDVSRRMFPLTRAARFANVHLSSSVPYSLNKKKRWSLPEKSIELEGSDTHNVTFIHRRVQSKLDADCFAVHKTKGNKVFCSKKHKYARVHDLLKNSESSMEEPELCYEMWHHFPSNAYPLLAEAENWRCDRYKLTRKGKGAKNKGRRWGMYSDEEVRNGKFLRDAPRLQNTSRNQTERKGLPKIAVLDTNYFRKCKEVQETPSRARFSNILGFYVEEPLQNTRNASKARQRNTDRKTSALVGCSMPKYGKNSAIYVDTGSCFSQDDSAEVPLVPPTVPLVTYQPQEKHAVTFNFHIEDVEPGNLEKRWKELYSEAGSLPRKFTIDLEPILGSKKCSCAGMQYACVLFEVVSSVGAGVNYVELATSCHAMRGDNDDDVKLTLESIGTKLLELERDVWSIEEIVNIAVSHLSECCQSHACTSNCRKRQEFSRSMLKDLNSVEMLGSMFGWKSEILVGAEATAQLKKNIKFCDDGHKGSNDSELGIDMPLEKFCSICYQEFITEENFSMANCTSLKTCQHVFCNACWTIHLQTQINSGHTNIKCPQFDCGVSVDDTTLMALIPSLYNVFLSRKIDKLLETNPELKWCPSNKCNRVVKVTASDMMKPIPVACSCGSLWCFQCGKQAHWPASCTGNEKFQEATKEFLKLMESGQKELITSVMVRNCPKCSYPIEKHLGCNFMYCIMCNTSFCWECLIPVSNHKDVCQRHERSKEVGLDPVDSQSGRFARYFTLFLSSRKSRSRTVFVRQLSHLNNVVTLYNYIQSSCSYTNILLEDLAQSSCLKDLESAAQFKYQAHLTLEGAAKMAIISKQVHKVLSYHIQRLQFILERIEGLMMENGVYQLVRGKNLKKMFFLVGCGKDCVFRIGHYLTKVNSKQGH